MKFIPDAEPRSRGIYRMSQPELEEVRWKLAELVEQGFITPCSSPWEAPVLFAIKKDGNLRFYVEFRARNRLTFKNGYTLLQIDEILDSLCEAKYFSKIYLMMEYYQIHLDEDAIPKSSFTTKYGSFQFTVIPFGHTNASGFFLCLLWTRFSLTSSIDSKLFILTIYLFIVRRKVSTSNTWGKSWNVCGKRSCTKCWKRTCLESVN